MSLFAKSCLLTEVHHFGLVYSCLLREIVTGLSVAIIDGVHNRPVFEASYG